MSKKKAPSTPPEVLALPPYGVDSHAHLDLAKFDEDRDEVIARAKECGIAHIMNIFLSPEAYMERKHYFDAHPNIFFSLGFHPSDGQQCTNEAVETMHEYFLQDARLKAVGEIGLDFYWDHCPKDIQLQIFISQLNMAKALQKPVIIHSREATDATLAVLEKEGFNDYPLLWHCFGGNTKDMKRIMHNGWYVSIPGAVTYPKNEELLAAAAAAPLEKLMLETDCPYLAPQEWRGKRNEPALTVFTAHHIAKAKGMDAAELWQHCGDNARRLFGIEGE